VEEMDQLQQTPAVIRLLLRAVQAVQAAMDI
jgi:hypothetical protein